MHVGLCVSASMLTNGELHDPVGNLKLTNFRHYINQTLRGIEMNRTIVATSCCLYAKRVECKDLNCDG